MSKISVIAFFILLFQLTHLRSKMRELKGPILADDDGNFILQNVPASQYIVEVSLIVYETLKQIANVLPAKTSGIESQV